MANVKTTAEAQAEETMRLECLRLAVTHLNRTQVEKKPIDQAKEFYDFIRPSAEVTAAANVQK